MVSPATVRRHLDIIKRAAKNAKDALGSVSSTQKLAKVRVIVCHPKVLRRTLKGDLVTTMRRGELAQMQWSDVEVDGGYLMVRERKNDHDRD